MKDQFAGEVIVFVASDGQISIDVSLADETVWLSQEQIAELFARDRTQVTRHIGNLFKEGELDEASNVRISHIASRGDRPTKLYSLDVVISVGYRVKSQRGTQFRIWANTVIKEHLLRGVSISNSALTALTLLVAESLPERKDFIVGLILNMLAEA